MKCFWGVNLYFFKSIQYSDVFHFGIFIISSISVNVSCKNNKLVRLTQKNQNSLKSDLFLIEDDDRKHGKNGKF